MNRITNQSDASPPLCIFYKSLKNNEKITTAALKIQGGGRLVADNNTNCNNIHNLLYLNLSAARVQAFGVSQDST